MVLILIICKYILGKLTDGDNDHILFVYNGVGLYARLTFVWNGVSIVSGKGSLVPGSTPLPFLIVCAPTPTPSREITTPGFPALFAPTSSPGTIGSLCPYNAIFHEMAKTAIGVVVDSFKYLGVTFF